LIKQRIRPYAGYYSTYKELLRKFYGAVRLFESSNNRQDINKAYGDLWDHICDFFSSKEYLGAYNPIFFHIKEKREKEDAVNKVFELDIEKDLYEALLHLIYKKNSDDRYDNLRKLQWTVSITKRWKDALSLNMD